MKGRVYLVGAGPGDPGLLTLRGKEVLGRADVVLYDALANPRILDFAPAGAERVLVGKRQGRESASQDVIETAIVRLAREGKTVVRLKGGDPFIFGRGGEEAEACRRAGIDFEVVPGVTSAVAVPAYAGIPLTHREHSSLVTFVTGQPGAVREGYDLDWEMLARGGGTLVFLMAMTSMGEIADKLIAAGLAPATPAAAVRWGTLPKQQSVVGTLADIAAKAGARLARPPVVLVVGAVAGLSTELSWFERLPLFGRRIVVTRARHQAGVFASVLEESGAWVIEFPTIEIRENEVSREVLQRAGSYDWIVFTSTNGVEAFFGQWLRAGRDLRELAGVRLAAIGPATRAAVEARGLLVAAQPAEYRAEALLETFGEVAGRRILLARAEVAREVLPERLRERGASVDVVAFYRTVVPQPVASSAPVTLDGLSGLPATGEPSQPVVVPGDFDMITFTSASTVKNFNLLCEGRAREVLRGKAVAAIGPITADALSALGIQTDVMPADYTIPALAEAIQAYFANRHPVA
ncbi:MAG: uroporphyrinogen-III C-methyltransferase [Deltaproteobacteria bacterium]|nr:uroporphyrinogen-III C-methyltransferase [Deltaproteobacteria bacterium]